MSSDEPLDPPLRRVGLLGGGVIGAGWAARFLVNGIDVALYDPSPQAERTVRRVWANAERATSSLVLAPLPEPGRLTVAATPELAVEGADFVQESAPERVELKTALLAAAERATEPGVVIASSTSGLRPTLLAEGLGHPERFCVGHPFNPVYLLPLVEVVGGRLTSPGTLGRAGEVYRSVGMHPLVLKAEIDGFVADRLLEALWREALWLVADGVATVSEIDDAIRYGAGLRWAAMGTFLTYRIGGGQAGMRHFMSQFGAALQWPWSKLTDVPELDQELLDTIVAQSDEQAAGVDVAELEVLRDRCLVAVLQALRGQEYGAGVVVQQYERALLARAHPRQADPGDIAGQAAAGPITVHRTRVPAAWIDYNGHLHESRYLQIVGDATDALLRLIGVDDDYLDSGHSFYTVETHLRFLRALSAGDEVDATVQILDADPTRVRAFWVLRHREQPVATAEQLYLHVDTRAQRACPAEGIVWERLAALATAHAGLAAPQGAGRRTGDPVPR